jgi:hypothetical protein
MNLQDVRSGSAISPDLTDVIAKYAARFHAALGGDHVVVSPLGAYLLLAAVAPAARGAVREDLERALGCPADVAGRFLADLLAEPHPAVASAIAIWTASEITTPALDLWRDSLPQGVERGQVPNQVDADEWVKQATGGLITKFPLAISPLADVLMASALATKATWKEAFSDAPAGSLGETPWAREVQRVLVDFDPANGLIVWTESAGLVGALISRAMEDLIVVSVIAEPQVTPAEVIAAAHEVAAWACKRPTGAIRRSLFDMPLESGHAWEIREFEIETDVEGEHRENTLVYLPAWKATSPAIDLQFDPAFGFGTGGAALKDLLDAKERDGGAQTVQGTVAKFDRCGFGAASVSAHASLGEAEFERPSRTGLAREVIIRFSRPFAVVAATLSRSASPHPWHGVPVYSAWVTTPSEPEPWKSIFVIEDDPELGPEN